jgi:hypothetical protein
MLLEYIAIYHKYLWLLLIAFSSLKLVLSYSFIENLQGVQGALYALFKWYGQEEQELEDQPSRRTVMRFHNLVTFAIYFILVIILIATILTKTIGH